MRVICALILCVIVMYILYVEFLKKNYTITKTKKNNNINDNTNVVNVNNDTKKINNNYTINDLIQNDDSLIFFDTEVTDDDDDVSVEFIKYNNVSKKMINKLKDLLFTEPEYYYDDEESASGELWTDETVWKDKIINLIHSKDYFIMLSVVDMRSSSVFDYLINKKEYKYNTLTHLDVKVFKKLEPYEITVLSTYGKGSLQFIKHGTNPYYNKTNYFQYKTIINRIHLLLGSSLIIEKIDRINGTARLLIQDKLDKTKQVNFIFYADKSPLQQNGPNWAAEYIQLPNKMIVEFKAITTKIPTTLHFEMITSNSYVNVYNLTKNIT